MDPIGGQAQVFIPAHTVIGAESVAQTSFQHYNERMARISEDAHKVARAYDELGLESARSMLKFNNAVFANLAVAGQTGDTSNQQTASPIRTGLGEDAAGGAKPANRAIDNATAEGAGSVAKVGDASAADLVAALTAFLSQWAAANQPAPKTS